MGTDLLKLSDFKENLINEVREKFANLIPQETLSKFIDEEYEKFIKDELPKIIQSVFAEEAKKMVIEAITNPNAEYGPHGDWKAGLSPIVKEALIEAAPDMFANVTRNMVAIAFNNMRNGY